MKHKLYLLVVLTLIAFIAITSYTPQTAQAETLMQEDPVSEAEEFPYPEAGEYPLEPDADDQINGNQLETIGAVGINFVPHDSDLTYYNAGQGCLASQYDGYIAKTFSIPVYVPDGVKGNWIGFTYRNTVANPSNGPIQVSLWRRYDTYIPHTEEVKKYTLNKTGEGGQYDDFDIRDLTFATGWIYWLEFKLPNGEATRQFCGFQIWYEKPPLFPVALPMINK